MKARNILLLGALGVAGVAVAAANDLFSHYEEPAYKIDREDGEFEIRSYPSVIAASVQVAGNGESSANNAFKILAGYIFGKNKRAMKISMTVPVIQESAAEKIAMTVPVTMEMQNMSMAMNFYMPSSYTLDTLPEPLDKRIKLERIPARRFAVIKFSGFGTESNCRKKEEQLRNWIKQHTGEKAGETLRAFYNPPWTLPFLRRNEIWISL